MHLCSPNLPIGGFSWSQGLEGAVDLQWVENQEQLSQWCDEMLRHCLGKTELPVMIKVYHLANQERQNLNHWNQFLLASRETQELKDESTTMGAALIKLGKQLYPQFSLPQNDWSYEIVLTRIAKYLDLPLDSFLAAFLWSWLENQILAASRLFPLGQNQMQKLLVQFSERFPELIESAKSIPMRDIGPSTPGLFIASAHHQYQYSRLFRS